MTQSSDLQLISAKTKEVRIVVPSGATSERLDKYLMNCNLDVTRAALNRLFQDKCITVDGGLGKKGSKVHKEKYIS